MTSPILPTSTTPTQTSFASDPTPSTERPDQFGKDTFLKLLVAQLKYQSPLQPTDPTTFLSQTAQFTVIEKLDQLAQLEQGRTANDQLIMGAALVGKNVTYELGGTTATAAVTGVRFERDGSPVLTLGDGQEAPLSAVRVVHPAT
jgi:flagellar basal-body rod modification protein FlgD